MTRIVKDVVEIQNEFPDLFKSFGIAFGGLGTGVVLHGEALILGEDGKY